MFLLLIRYRALAEALLLRQFFTCGSSKVAQGVKKVLTEIITDCRFSDKRAAAAFEKAFQGRYTTDIFEA